jgi:hypothetical protein
VRVRNIATATVAALLGLTASGRAVVQTYSAATGEGGEGADHPGGGFHQADPGNWDTGLDSFATSPPNGQFVFSGSVDAFHMEARAIQNVGFTGQTGDHAAYFQMNYIGPAGVGSFWFGGIGNDLGPWPKSGGVPVAPADVLVYADVLARAGTPMELRTESQFILPNTANGFERSFTATGTWQTVGGSLADTGVGTFGNFDEDDPEISTLIAFGQNANAEITIDDGSDPLNIPDVFVDNLTMTIREASWSTDSSGSWSDNSKWSPIAPDGGNARAIFGSAITAPQTVTLDGEHFAGTLVFDNVSSYTLDGSGPMSLRAINTPEAGGTFSAITVVAGSHTIAAPVILWGDTTMTITPPGSTLAITGALSAQAGTTITKAGPGTLQVEHVRASGLNVTAGKLVVSAKGTPNSDSGTSVVQTLSIAPGAQLDLSNNSAIIDYTGAVGSLVDDTRQHLQAGRLTSSASVTDSRGLGYADNAALDEVKTSFGGQSVDASSILIKYTYLGDSDLDGDVDVADLGKLATAWQTANAWSNGDFDYSGTVNVGDLGLLATNWQAGVGSPLGPGFAEAAAALGLPSAAVPEAGAMMGVGVLAMVSASRRTRRGPA